MFSKKKSILFTCQVLLLGICLESCYFSPVNSGRLKVFFSFPTCVFGEADAEWRLLDLLCEQILLVEEKNDGSVDEELVVADRVKQHQRLVHAILWRRKEEEGEREKDGKRWKKE